MTMKIEDDDVKPISFTIGMHVHRLQDGYFDVEPTSFTIGMRVHRMNYDYR